MKVYKWTKKENKNKNKNKKAAFVWYWSDKIFVLCDIYIITYALIQKIKNKIEINRNKRKKTNHSKKKNKKSTTTKQNIK